MLISTLQSLVMAGKDALRTTCGLPVLSEDITQVRHGNLTFPSLGEIAFSGGTLQHLHLGCDALLCAHLAENVNPCGEDIAGCDGGGNGLEFLAQRFLDSVLEEMEGRHPRGWVENLAVGPRTLTTRGVRTFGFRFRTEVGNLYLMAEVPSKAEWEQAKGSEFLSAMIATYLPDGWTTRDRIDMSADLDKFLIFLRKTELDVQVDVPGHDEAFTVHTGTLVEATQHEGRRALRLTMDLSDAGGRELQRGDRLFCRVGLKDRAVHFTCQFLGMGDYAIAGSASVKCVYFTLPDALKVEQRRRAFRINPGERIPVEIIPAPDENAAPVPGQDRDERVRGRLADLSFSGARIVSDRVKLLARHDEGDRVICRMHFPEESRPLEILGLIRRATVGVKKDEGPQGEIGIEFLVTEHMDRSALEYIRQYVLSQQRAWLAQRIHTAGAPQW